MIDITQPTLVPAKWTGPRVLNRPVDLIVIHAMQYAERPDAAEIIANDFATRSADNKASAQWCIDNNSAVRCVDDDVVAYAAPGANKNGVHLELAGFSEQDAAGWHDAFSIDVLENTAEIIVQYCKKYAIPPVHLTNDELKAGQRGIVGHKQVSDVYKLSDHQDPGPNFPWDYLLARVAALME